MAATTISRDTLTNDDGSGTTGDIVNAANLAAWFYDNIDAIFTTSQTIEVSQSGSMLLHTISNTSDTASSSAGYLVKTAGTTAADPVMLWAITSGATWCAGIDNSDGDKWKLCANVTQPTTASAVIEVTTNRHVILPEQDGNPSTGDLPADAAVSIYTKADKFVIAYNNGGTMTYITLDLDGSDTSWTHGTSAP